MKFKKWYQQFSSALLLALGLSVMGQAAQAQDRGPSTEQERARVVQIAEATNKDPLGLMRSADGRWFTKWAQDVPDYTFAPDAGIFWFKTGMDKEEIKGDMIKVARFVHGVNTAAYQVQHGILEPHQKAEESLQVTLAGMNGLLTAYENLRDKSPDNRSAYLDLALEKRQSGKLLEFVQSLPPLPKR